MDKEIVGLKFSINVDLEKPISMDEFSKLLNIDLMAKIDEILCKQLNGNCRAIVSPKYKDE